MLLLSVCGNPVCHGRLRTDGFGNRTLPSSQFPVHKKEKLILNMRRPHGKSICSTIWRGNSGGWVWVWIWGCLFNFPQHKWWKSIECAPMLEFPSFWLRTVKIFIQCSSSAAGAEWNGSSFGSRPKCDDEPDEHEEFRLQRQQSCWAVQEGGQMGGQTDGRTDGPWMIRTRLNCHLMSIQWQLF